MTNYEQAADLNSRVKAKNSNYWVAWNPDIQIWEGDGKFGAFEIGCGDKVHYRRKTYSEVLDLIK